MGRQKIENLSALVIPDIVYRASIPIAVMPDIVYRASILGSFLSDWSPPQTREYDKNVCHARHF